MMCTRRYKGKKSEGLRYLHWLVVAEMIDVAGRLGIGGEN